ncbi:hypothetical protein [Streptococcus minor]|uniref:hypothetical protein n=1 Tax=Streptococcus minor TaxID=229549 RepID=UPI000369A8D8|nr:hypothetical protein [Streptococcus minor]
MKKTIVSSYFVLALATMSACATSPVTKEIDVAENTAAYSKTYRKQTLDGSLASSDELVVDDTKRKEAYDQLQEYKAGIKEKAILNALSIVDEFYISNNTLQATRKAYGVTSENDVYEKLFSFFIKDRKADLNYKMPYKGTTYKLSEVGPKALKVNINSLQESAAYEVVFSKLEDNKVYLHLRVPIVDSYQYYVQATYRDNYEEFFYPLEMELTAAQGKDDINKNLLVLYTYYLEAVGGEEGSVDLAGMTWGELRDIYLVLDVNKDQSISISDEMLGAVSQVDASSVNKKWESTFQKWEAEN